MNLSNLYKKVKSTLMLGLFSASVSVLATPVQALPFQLKPLTAEQPLAVKQAKALATIAMIYQPDCSWCKKQGKTLAKAFEQCQASVNIVLVGTQGNARQLKKELKHYHNGIPAYKADRQFLRKIGGYQASPTTLIFDEHGEMIVKKRGFIDEDKLANALSIVSRNKCLI